MIDGKPRLRAILRINGRFVVAALMLFYAWLCWQWASPEWWGLGLLAIFAGLSGGIAALATVCEVVALIVRDRKVAAFTRQGGEARADRMANEDDLRKNGVIR